MTRSALFVSAWLALAGTAWAQGRDGNAFETACRPPLKFAAGACVSECPAGYEDRGRTCDYRNTGTGGGGGGR